MKQLDTNRPAPAWQPGPNAVGDTDAQVTAQAVTGLDPLRFPLHAQRLIEASAGTGKTFTLALLYTRLVLGHGPGGSAFERPLMPPEILVVTFTDAATKELRARIRTRLVEAAVCFAEEFDPATADHLLMRLRADYPPADWPGCASRLRQAAEWMDEAMIATIHGFCQRMLKEHAFATRGLFQRELVEDQSGLLLDALRDYWRLHFYPLPAEQIGCIQAIVASPEGLKTKLRDWLLRRDLAISYQGKPVPVEDLRAPLTAACDQHEREQAAAAMEDKARQLWNDHREPLENLLRELRAHLNGTSHGSADPEKFEQLLGQLADWSQGGAAPGKLANFAQGAFKFKKGAKVQQEPAHPAFQAIADWQSEVERVRTQSVAPDPPLEPRLLAHVADWLGRELPRRLGQRAEMGFDDLLRDLDAALNPPACTQPAAARSASADPARARELAAALRTQFPVALIDEFQDTDPLQYRIFARIYALDAPGTASESNGAPSEDPAQPSALVMIGDPKQAIYGFRGADIHAYLAARAAVRGQLATLKTNYRSTQALVDACNHLFTHAEQHPDGAFRFRASKTPEQNPIPFVQVSASGQQDQLVVQGQPAPAMTLWWLEGEDNEPVAITEYRPAMAAAAASEILRWLKQAEQGQAGFKHHNGSWQPLRPRDIAILVRTGTEAAVVREALAARRINSVYLSDRESVFATPEAADVLHWLAACADPNDESLVRAALGTNTLALPLQDFDHWQRAELAWEAQLERFRDYRHIWQARGVLAALHRLMHDHDLPARLLTRPEGERALTNLLHLAEWLQQAETELDGEQALIRHLSEHLGPQESNEESILRLESDAELVQVVTIHKSKGLEYPLVLLPFICSWREVTGKDRTVLYRSSADPDSEQDSEPDTSQAEPTRSIEVAGKEAFEMAWQQADAARLSEDMRLLYVAVTRASHGLWLGVAPLKSGNSKSPQLHKSALGYALNGHARFASNDAVHQCLKTLADGCQAIALVPLPPADDQVLQTLTSASLEPAREPGHRPFSPWWISSYSALRLGMTAPIEAAMPGPDADTAPEEIALEESALKESKSGREDPPVREDSGKRVGAQATLAISTASPFPVALHDFPRGSRAGTFLHGLLEWAGKLDRVDPQTSASAGRDQGFAATAASPGLRRDMLARRCVLRGLADWIDPLNDWLGAMLIQPWMLRGLPHQADPPSALILASLAPSQVQIELEFWIETRAIATQRLDALVQQHCLAGDSRPRLRAGQLNGMLKGFIDLVFEHQGRFYVLDWKSNWLGPDDSAYTPAAMRGAILHHRYDLQYLLYLLALHRLLGTRLPDYDYDRHIGGAVYVFLRGAGAPSQGLFTDRPPRVLIEALDGLFAGRV